MCQSIHQLTAPTDINRARPGARSRMTALTQRYLRAFIASLLRTVNIQEFESQYQESVSKILNELQSMAIISNRLETTIVDVGTSVQNLNQMVEDFLRQQQESNNPQPENRQSADRQSANRQTELPDNTSK